MKIYIDSNYKCYKDNAPGRREVEHPFFDGLPIGAIGCYKYNPERQFIQCYKSDKETGIRQQHEIDDANIKDLVTFLPDDAAIERTALFPEWESWKDYTADFRVQYNGLLYRCVQAHTAQANWTPDITPALWARVSVDECPEWIQPTGAQDAYKQGDKVTHNNKRWISTVDNNTWEPGVYGWHEVQ